MLSNTEVDLVKLEETNVSIDTDFQVLEYMICNHIPREEYMRVWFNKFATYLNELEQNLIKCNFLNETPKKLIASLTKDAYEKYEFFEGLEYGYDRNKVEEELENFIDDFNKQMETWHDKEIDKLVEIYKKEEKEATNG